MLSAMQVGTTTILTSLVCPGPSTNWESNPQILLVSAESNHHLLCSRSSPGYPGVVGVGGAGGVGAAGGAGLRHGQCS